MAEQYTDHVSPPVSRDHFTALYKYILYKYK